MKLLSGLFAAGMACSMYVFAMTLGDSTVPPTVYVPAMVSCLGGMMLALSVIVE